MQRRPLKTRSAKWAQSMAKKLAGLGITPNQISLLSVFFAALAAISFYYSKDSNSIVALFLAALFIQLRLICNLMDGMVAVEHNKKTVLGDIFNDVPDRFADFFIIVGAGYAVSDHFLALPLAYTGGAVAILTAYIRVLGASLKSPNYFSGIMAKPQRMAILTVSALVNIVLVKFDITFNLLYISLWIIVVGGLVTCFTRLAKIVKDLKGTQQC
ncbi:CDP-alcohol phosphatidyltransferase family protein [Halobacteriovorax sp. HLS]|uniref:CDP-alcohol phosphatidyltransferase family protein n=1 Tax=Halobacteriovorax sp. HLS TaxID=2234000 RepID=UPI000FD874DA|nr:CDP-alcohol phosphatidyltransferase family protein [Halobacteriovorax sp. HLS]